MKYDVLFYENCDEDICCVDERFFDADSIDELDLKAKEHADNLVKEGYEIAGWNYHKVE